MGKAWVAIGMTAATLIAAGCASEASGDETSSDELISTPLNHDLMVRVDTPDGMPTPWEQPDSTGVFNQHGKCGPTAVANALRLYGVEVSPDDADKAGVHFVVGSLAHNLSDYFDKYQPQLDCGVDHPWNGTKYLHEQLDGGHPVMLWFNTDGGFQQSHWVVAVAHHGDGSDEKVVVMSWGAYYEIPMEKLEQAWRFVLGLPHPAVVCKAKSSFVR